MSTMRIVTPEGSIKEVEKVHLMVEKRFMFNGHERRVVEKAESLEEKPTAMSIMVVDSNNMYSFLGGELFIGNLKPETVVEIQQSLLKDGFYDFGGMEYQRVKDFSKTTFDHGESLPYTSEFSTPIISSGVMGIGMRTVPCLDGTVGPLGGYACPLSDEPFTDSEEDYEGDGEDCEDDGGEDE